MELTARSMAFQLQHAHMQMRSAPGGPAQPVMPPDTHGRAGVIPFRRTGPLSQLGRPFGGAGIWPPARGPAVQLH